MLCSVLYGRSIILSKKIDHPISEKKIFFVLTAIELRPHTSRAYAVSLPVKPIYLDVSPLSSIAVSTKKFFFSEMGCLIFFSKLSFFSVSHPMLLSYKIYYTYLACGKF